MRRSLPRSILWCFIVGGSLASLSALADSTPTFNNITDADYGNIVKELSSNFSYSTQTPASSLGGLGGFEIGVIGGVTNTPNITDLVKRNDPSFSENKFPHGGALVRMGLPKGLTVEGVILPKVNASSLSLSQYGGSVMWTITDVIWKRIPLSLAVKAFYNKTSLSYKQTINNGSTAGQDVDAAIDFDNSNYGAQLLASHLFFGVLEPYLGVGYIKAKGDLSISAATRPSATFFASGENSATSKPNSAILLAGLDIRLFFVSLGGEYKSAFGTNSYSGRLSFRF